MKFVAFFLFLFCCKTYLGDCKSCSNCCAKHTDEDSCIENNCVDNGACYYGCGWCSYGSNTSHIDKNDIETLFGFSTTDALNGVCIQLSCSGGYFSTSTKWSRDSCSSGDLTVANEHDDADLLCLGSTIFTTVYLVCTFVLFIILIIVRRYFPEYIDKNPLLIYRGLCMILLVAFGIEFVMTFNKGIDSLSLLLIFYCLLDYANSMSHLEHRRIEDCEILF